MRTCRMATLWALALFGCDSAASYSAPVGINLKAKSGDVVQNVVSDKKAITTESGNPYGAFVNAAQQRLGRDPSRIEITGISLILGADSTGVTGLEQVFTGQVDVLFLMNDTNNTYNAGHVINPTGPGPVQVAIDFNGAAVSSVDYPKLLNGSFSVVVRGPAAASFPGAGAQASLQTNFTFVALE
jgi:hypothetical protein